MLVVHDLNGVLSDFQRMEVRGIEVLARKVGVSPDADEAKGLFRQTTIGRLWGARAGASWEAATGGR